MYLVVALQHPLVILILRALPGREGGFLLPPVDAEVLRPVDTLLPHLDEFRIFGRLRSVLLLSLRGRRHFRRRFRLAFVTAVLVLVTLIGVVLVFVTLVRFLLTLVIVIVVVIVFMIGFMSVIVRVRELRAE